MIPQGLLFAVSSARMGICALDISERLQESEFSINRRMAFDGKQSSMNMPVLTKTKTTTGTKRGTKEMPRTGKGWFGKRR